MIDLGIEKGFAKKAASKMEDKEKVYKRPEVLKAMKDAGLPAFQTSLINGIIGELKGMGYKIEESIKSFDSFSAINENENDHVKDSKGRVIDYGDVIKIEGLKGTYMIDLGDEEDGKYATYSEDREMIGYHEPSKMINIGWMDPAGGVHSHDDKDPAKKYE
jgi:hypothetical protein